MPYRNIAQYGPDLIAGRCRSASSGIRTSPAPIQAKGAIPLAVAGDKRIPALPDTPTTTEAGMPRIQGQRLVRAARAGRHAEADPGEAQQGNEGRAEDPAVKKGFDKARAPRRCALPLDQVKKWHHDEIEKYRDIITKAGIAKIE